jgi:hypothetical protein
MRAQRCAGIDEVRLELLRDRVRAGVDVVIAEHCEHAEWRVERGEPRQPSSM